MNQSNLLLCFAILAGFVVLCGLGIWQLQRLEWKEALIARVEERKSGEPELLPEIEDVWANAGDVDYLPVRLSGTFDHRHEQYYYNTLDGTVGWNVYTPLVLDDGRVVFVNRGFVPDRLRAPQTRADGNIEGRLEIVGLARNPVTEKPNRFMPDNDTARNQFFWRNLSQMASAAGIDQDRLVPFFVDAGTAPNPGGWPLGGTTRVSFPNDHLQYAITWFGLAAALAGVGGYFIWSRARPRQA